MSRILTARPVRATVMSLPRDNSAPSSVPVTTVPAPAMVKTRSTNNRARPSSSRDVPAPAANPASASTSVSIPSPVTAEVGMVPCQRTGLRDSRCAISAVRDATSLLPTLSHLVSATTPCDTPRTSSTPRCSSVCGIHPSFASTTSIAMSTPLTPATIVRTKSACPGTSTKLSTVPSGAVQWANPSSIVIPRRFSSASRSGSVPHIASTSEDFPWST